MPVGFAVPAGDLAYSVEVFCSVSTVCLGVLILRRKVIGFELGGPPVLAALTERGWATELLAGVGDSGFGSSSACAQPNSTMSARRPASDRLSSVDAAVQRAQRDEVG